MAPLYGLRAIALERLSLPKIAIPDIDKAIELNRTNARYYSRSVSSSMDLAVLGRNSGSALFFGLFARYASDDVERYGAVLIAAVLNRCQPGVHVGSCSDRHRISALVAYARAAHNTQHVVDRVSPAAAAFMATFRVRLVCEPTLRASPDLCLLAPSRLIPSDWFFKNPGHINATNQTNTSLEFRAATKFKWCLATRHGLPLSNGCGS